MSHHVSQLLLNYHDSKLEKSSLKVRNYSPNKKEFDFYLFYHACPGRPGKYALR